jgi:hypothetical protein
VAQSVWLYVLWNVDMTDKYVGRNDDGLYEEMQPLLRGVVFSSDSHEMLTPIIIIGAAFIVRAHRPRLNCSARSHAVEVARRRKCRRSLFLLVPPQAMLLLVRCVLLPAKRRYRFETMRAGSSTVVNAKKKRDAKLSMKLSRERLQRELGRGPSVLKSAGEAVVAMKRAVSPAQQRSPAGGGTRLRFFKRAGDAVVAVGRAGGAQEDPPPEQPRGGAPAACSGS